MEDVLKIQRLLNDYQTQQQMHQIANQAFAGLTVIPVEPFTLEQTLNIINQHPEVVKAIVENNEALQLEDEFVGGGSGDFIDTVDLNAILEKMKFTPSEIHLAAKDYRNIKKYLKGKMGLTDLTIDQQRIVDTLRAKNEDFFLVGKEGGYTFRDDGVRFRNLRQQLLKRLNIDDTLPTSAAKLFAEREAMMPDFFDIKSLEKSPSIKPFFEKPGPGLIELQNLKKPDIIPADPFVDRGDGDIIPPVQMQDASKIPKPAPGPELGGIELAEIPDVMIPSGKGTLWFLQDPSFIDLYARENWTQYFDMNVHGKLSGPEMNQKLLMESQMFGGRRIPHP